MDDLTTHGLYAYEHLVPPLDPTAAAAASAAPAILPPSLPGHLKIYEQTFFRRDMSTHNIENEMFINQ